MCSLGVHNHNYKNECASHFYILSPELDASPASWRLTGTRAEYQSVRTKPEHQGQRSKASVELPRLGVSNVRSWGMNPVNRGEVTRRIELFRFQKECSVVFFTTIFRRHSQHQVAFSSSPMRPTHCTPYRPLFLRALARLRYSLFPRSFPSLDIGSPISTSAFRYIGQRVYPQPFKNTQVR